jgi:pyruvate dehydrogenase E2 component (dihydrolipoamide acetyltransferase)
MCVKILKRIPQDEGGRMPTEVKLPLLGENLEGGGVVDVKVAPGAVVKEGDTLLEVDAGKATLEVPAPMAGRIVELKVKKGDQIQVGQVICTLDAPDGAAAKPAPKPATAPPRKEAAPPAPKPAAEEPKPPAPPPTEAPKPPPARQPEQPAVVQPAATATDRQVLAGPATRRLARELGVPLERVRGSGREGRITEDDVREFVRQLAVAPAPLVAANGQAPALPNFEQWGPVERQPLSHIRKLTARQMSLAWNLVPHVTQHDLADVTVLEAFRKQQPDGKGPKLTMTAFALKACAIALKEFPTFNASLDTANEQLVLKRYYHIGVAVDTDHGLLVPVIRDVNKKSVQELAAEVIAAAEAARARKGELTGGTFTITNLGGIGGTAFTPIVNYPEVAILGLSRSRLQPAVHEGQVVPRLLLPLSLSYDHRVIDGAAAARFTRRIAELLENPLVMLLHA